MKKLSWQTTTAGIGALLAVAGQVIAVLTDGNPQTNPDWNSVLAQVALAIGLIRARDNNRSSEDVGAKP